MDQRAISGEAPLGPEIEPSSPPLAGITVIDLSSTFMGPFATLILAQMGARVIKVESPSGDVTRNIGDRHGAGLGPIFLNANRGKESVVLNLKTQGGRDALDLLLEESDVFVHNLRPATAARIGVDSKTLTDRHRHLVVCNTIGYGSEGPMADKAAYDDVIQAASGLAMIQTDAGGAPQYVKSAIADKTVGLMAVSAILAALFERERSGVGQAVEIPMLEAMVSFLSLEHQGGLVFLDEPGEPGYARIESPHRRPYKTLDGYVAVVIYTDAHWLAFFSSIGRPDLAKNAEYSDIGRRTKHIDELYELVEQQIATRTTAEWLDDLESRGIPVSPVNRLSDLLADPHLRAVGTFETVEHPTEGALIQVRAPWRYSRSQLPQLGPAPSLGTDTARILDEFGARDTESSQNGGAT